MTFTKTNKPLEDFLICKIPSTTELSLALGKPGWLMSMVHLYEVGALKDLKHISHHFQNAFENVTWDLQKNTAPIFGQGGLVYSLAHITKKIPDFNLATLKLMNEWWDLTQQRKEVDNLDFVTGKAGICLALIEFKKLGFELGGSNDYIKLTYDKLIDELNAFNFDNDLGINLGLSHGLAGKLLSLEILNHYLGQKNFSSIRNASLENFYLSLIEISDMVSAYPVESLSHDLSYNSWCHGTPGILLSFYYAHIISGDDKYLLHMEKCIKSLVLASGGPTFCCGLIGRAEILRELPFLTDRSLLDNSIHKMFSSLSELKIGTSLYQGSTGYEYFNLREKLKIPLVGFEFMKGFIK